MAAVKRMIDRIVNGHTGLAAPGDLKATAVADTSISLSWSAVPSATGFDVYRDGTRASSNPVSATSFTDNGLSPGTTYSYTVAAVDSAGTEGALSNPLTITTTGTPAVAAPTDVKIDAVTASSVTLSWKGSTGVRGFDVFRGGAAGGPYTKANAALITDVTFTDTALTASTTYFYDVKSVDNSGGSSAPSAEVHATTEPPPACFTATNFDHVMAGRAHDVFFAALANGSNQIMGLDNIFIVTTLKQIGPDNYIIGACESKQLSDERVLFGSRADVHDSFGARHHPSGLTSDGTHPVKIAAR
jgi:chitodextrinase